MGKTRNKNPRNVALLSGRPLSETIEPSSAMITNFQEEWVTSKDLTEPSLPYVPQVMDSLTVFMLGNININSTHLFRADILHDSLGILKTPQQKEQKFAETGNNKAALSADIPEAVEPLPAREIVGFELTRTVVRRLIPRNPKVDFPIEQTCHFYKGDKSIPVTPSNDASGDAPTNTTISRYLVVYSPHIKSKAENPFYHPLIQGLAYLYDYDPSSSNSTEESTGSGTLSLHFVLYPDEPIQTRLERTLHILINNHIRLARNTRLSEAPEADGYNHNKDNIVPRHQAQDTYLRLKFKYAPDLCERWVEKTDPSKHVFEDLAITAFLIELWRNMYGVVPIDERDENTQELGDPNFPGFVDVACGNGLLVYVLLMEGYQGWGFDARRRKTWGIFPEHVQARLKEEIYIPKPFVDEMMASGAENELQNLGVKYHSGMFPEDTFIISNHADELTPWTPLMAALANPASPLPFIAIPCCSHSLSGAKYRYPPPKKASVDKHDNTEEGGIEQNPQPASGDLRALRLAKHEAQTEAGFYKSMYGALTTKTMSITEDIGCEVEKTLLRIPSTRNMGVIGGRKATTEKWRQKTQNPESSMHPTDVDNEETIDRIVEVVHRECYREGGISTAARIWIERAKGLHQGQGKGKESGH